MTNSARFSRWQKARGRVQSCCGRWDAEGRGAIGKDLLEEALSPTRTPRCRLLTVPPQQANSKAVFVLFHGWDGIKELEGGQLDESDLHELDER